MNRKSCFLSFFLIIIIIISLLNLDVANADRNINVNGDGVYIVYTGAAASSSAGFPSDHILSSSSFQSWKDRVVHSYNNAFSGFAARLSEEEAKLIAQRPEVVSVFPDTVIQLHTTRSWDFLKELSSTSGSGLGTHQIPKSNSSEDLSAQDVIIGIIDTGIWPEAKSFNDKGLGPIPRRWKGECIKGRDSFKCNRKLIGARNYVTDDGTSARDRNGHGTHVAAIAAGRAVLGASYKGLARGTARGGSPGSRIAVYRVCNDIRCDGSTVLKAFDDAIADGVDIISLSSGEIEKPGRIYPISIGAFHAVEKGIIVVASAGDAGSSGIFDDNSVQRIFNFAPWMLTVGATTIDRYFESDVVLGGNKLVIKGRGAHFANLKKSPIYGLIDGASAKRSGIPDNWAGFCSTGTLDAEKVKGKIVVCYSSDPTRGSDDSIETKIEQIKSIGGIGMLYTDWSEEAAYGVYATIPALGISYDDAGKILSYIKSTRNPVATILPTVDNPRYKPAPSVPRFSGHGSMYYSSYTIKPDVVAPGVNILSAWPSNETDQAFNLLSGSSMACPHVSAIAALVKSKYPNWTPSAIRSAVMTTANPTNNVKAPITTSLGVEAGNFYSGSGKVTLSGPLQPGLVYETEINDYLMYYCYNGYNASQIRLLSSSIPASFSCPTKSTQEFISDINYPSIAISLFGDHTHQTVKRTVTNVGDEEETVYKVSVEKTKNLEIHVSPNTLRFTKNQKKLSYRVSFRSANNSSDAYEQGSITWSNQKYSVRIPFVFSWSYFSYFNT